MAARAQLEGWRESEGAVRGDAGQRDEMKACTGTFQSLPGAFRGSKDVGESEEGMERWGRRAGAGRGAKQRRWRRRGGRMEGRAGSQREAEEADRRLTR